MKKYCALICLQVALSLAAVPFFSAVRADDLDSVCALLPDGATILFQGDSITDGGRDHNATDLNRNFGQGYAYGISAEFLGRFPEKNLTFHNRGVNGNTVGGLRARWDADCLALEPSVVSILVGVNDYWVGITPDDYEKGYDELLQYTKEKLPNATIVIIEPFAFKASPASERSITEYAARAKALADKYGAVFVPMQDRLAEKIAVEPREKYWSWDGVHLTPAGGMLLRDAWISAFAAAKR